MACGGWWLSHPQTPPLCKPDTPASEHLQEALPLGDLVAPSEVAGRVWAGTACASEAQISLDHDWEELPLILTF